MITVWKRCLARKLVFIFQKLSHVSGTLALPLTDPAILGYFHWGCIKSKVYRACPAYIDDLKQQIGDCIQGIPKEIL
jgi:hypothetical protein